ncbi:hypothetical protein [Streptomyces sp. DSM 40484]|jgi:3-oxoadipate enol-lactonase|uniref:hypothetical protein n=1 Tax=Streptomyces kroppenstedtii TaxID=3051181 RepID=UPI0034D97EA8
MAADPSAPPELSEYVRSVNGIELHVTEAGSGAPLLMLHGVGVEHPHSAARSKRWPALTGSSRPTCAATGAAHVLPPFRCATTSTT